MKDNDDLPRHRNLLAAMALVLSDRIRVATDSAIVGVSITVAMLILIARLDDPGGSGRRHADDIVLA